MSVISLFLLILAALPLCYWYVLAVAAFRKPKIRARTQPSYRIALTIPAHNEESVIEATVARLRAMDYPPELFDIAVVADHCTDHTAQVARSAGAQAYERDDGNRGGKGTALKWLFDILLNPPAAPGFRPYDAIVVFDADTRVDPQFLRIMDARLSQGDRVIQGQHRISNPDDGWFPALTWAMFIVDNRLQNLGRSNLNFSAKNMGDSICVSADVLRRYGWGEGLTEDYAFRQNLLLNGIQIRYEPDAIGLGEAPANWQIARKQRARWLRGTHDASRHYGLSLAREALRRREPALFDGLLQATLPSYSTMTLIAGLLWLIHMASALTGGSWLAAGLFTVLLFLMMVYPFIGLALEHAPGKAYLVMLSGPIFIVWRTTLALASRFGRRTIEWVRTPRRANIRAD